VHESWPSSVEATARVIAPHIFCTEMSLPTTTSPPTIHHLLCTHCTFGTSALENASAEAASRVLGYSVRASSIKDRTRLREEFRAIERLLSYELPSDATAEHKKRLNALTAPLRLLHVPDIAGRQVVGQVAFRQFDTSNRPGSYFAHLLVGAAATPWPALDALRLCGLNDPAGTRGWCHADRDEGFPDLAGMSSLENWLARDRTWLTDRLVREFLRTGKVVVPEVYGEMLSDRWAANTTPHERLDLLKAVAQAILDRESIPSIVLAVEPCIAAVLFYGSLRILPAACHRAVSFSTYEPDPFRTAYRLVATVFVNDATDFRPDAYQSASLVVNTFRKPFAVSVKRPTPGAWGDWATERFMAEKTEDLDDVTVSVGLVWAKDFPTIAELNEIPHLEKYLRDLFRNQPGSPGRQLTAGHHQYLALRCSGIIHKHRQALGRLPREKSLRLVRNLQKVFAATPDEWRRLLKDPVIQEWVNQAQPTDEHGVQRQLMQPVSIFSDSDAALLVLSSDCVVRERRLPAPTPSTRRLWGDWSSPAAAAAYKPPDLLLAVLAQLPSGGLTRILPCPIPPLAVVRALLVELARRLPTVIGTSPISNAHAALRMHLRQILNEAAGDPAAVSGDDCLGPEDFESLLETAGDCRDHYDDSSSSQFGGRVSAFILGFPHRAQEVCRDPRLITLGLHWAGCATNSSRLTRQLTAWKRLLSWIGFHLGNDKVPFTNFWMPGPGTAEAELRAVVEDIVSATNNIDPHTDRKELLKCVIRSCMKEGWLKQANKQKFLTQFLLGLFPNP
jgi:hypothetical protein